MERPLTNKFDSSRTPSKLYTEYAKPALVVEQNHPIVPSNIQSYLDNTEPIYQNETPKKFYELVTPQKFTKPAHTPIKSSESFTSPFIARPVPLPVVPVSTPDVVKEEKKKKWSLGGLFRRRKKDSESESSTQEEDQKLGFLARRRSRREKRKQRANKAAAAGFDVVIKPRQTTPVELSPDSLSKTSPLSSSHDRVYSSSGSVDGLSRRERRSVIKQRAEALRQRGSSSEEDTSLHRSGSLNRRSRYARTERYIKRLSREEEAVLAREAAQRGYIDSATPSPAQSPQVRVRVLHHPPQSVSNPASLERKPHLNPTLRTSQCYSVRGNSPLPPNHPHPRSLSYDNDIHRLNTPPSPESVMVVQFPVARLFQGRKTGPPPPPPRDPQRRVTQDQGRPMSFAFDDSVRRTQGGSFLSLNTDVMQVVRVRQRPASVTPGDVRTRVVVSQRAPFQYFADQTPRSRKPIHIQATSEQYQPMHNEQYMSDSQAVIIKPPPSRQPMSQASEFWRQKELEAQRSPKPKSLRTDSLSSLGSDSSLENQRRKERPLSVVVENHEQKKSQPLKSKNTLKPAPEITTKSKSPQETARGKISEPVEKPKLSVLKSNPVSVESCPKFMSTPVDYSTKTSPVQIKAKPGFPEPPITSKDFCKTSPPAPPVRRFSRQLSSSSLEEPRQSNLEDALDELEAIYQSLRLGDEDLLDRAERRDLPTKFQLRESLPGSMSDSGYDLTPNTVRRRAPPSKRAGVPDKVTDDMAYRRLHPKDRPNSQNIVSQAGSFLLTSPVLSQASSFNQLDQEHLNNNEPDVTFDDVVYRNIRHANNSLKISEPQPLFGIPIGPVTPSPNNDYIHSKPSERYRPTFKPRRTPDVINDDLAYRNLRKDNVKDSTLLTAVETALHNARLKDSNFSLRKRRAVRSLSANLPSLIGQDKTLAIVDVNLPETNNFEKAQSLTHLPDALEIAQKILEGKEVIGGGSSHRWTAGNPKNADRNSLGMSTSTETLTDSRANLSFSQDGRNKRNSWQHKLRVNIPTELMTSPRLPPMERKNLDQNVLPPASVDTSQASTTESSPILKNTIFEHSGGLPIPDSVPGSPLDEAQLEDLLSALAREARVTSEQLGQQLAGFEAKIASEQLAKQVAGFEAKIASEQLAKQVAGFEAKIANEQLARYNTRRTDDISDDSLDSFGHDVIDAKSTPEIKQTKPASKDEQTNTKQVVHDEYTKPKPNATEKFTKQVVKDEDTKAVVMNDDHIKPVVKDRLLKPTKPVTVKDDQTKAVVEDEPEQCESVPRVDNPRIASIINEIDPSVTLDEFITSFTTSTPLEPLHIYEPHDLLPPSTAESSDSMSDGDQEVEAILHWETTRRMSEEGGTSKEGTGRSGMTWFGQEPRHVLMACTYCIACTQQMIGLDWLTALGILIAIVALLALIMLYR